MDGYVARKGNRWYAVIYHGLDPITGRELYTRRLQPSDGSRPLSRKSVLEIDAVIRGALGDVLVRGVISRNVASVASRPTIRNVPSAEPRAREEAQLRTFLHAAAGHRPYAAFRLSAATGMRRSEVLGLKWSDVDWVKSRISVDRGLVSVGYERQVTRCKTESSRRQVELDPTTLAMLRTWRDWQESSTAYLAGAVPEWLFPAEDGGATHPHSFSQAFDRIVRRAGLPPTRLHDLRHTHASLLIKNGVPLKVLSERLGHAKASFTMDTYQHVLPGMQADAAQTYERLVATITPSRQRRPASTGSTR